MKSREIELRTPEGVVFRLPLAGPVARALAWLVDISALSAAGIVLQVAFNVVSILSVDLGQALAVLVGFVLMVGYWIVCEWLWRGQTLGKRLLRLRVVDSEGGRLTASQVVLRNLLRAVDTLPALYLVGCIAILSTRREQRIGDLVAGTLVLRTRTVELPDIDEALRVKYNSLRTQAHLASRLRQRLTPAEAMLGLSALLRIDSLDPDARIELFARLAEHYRSIVPYPPEVVDVLADEQYVRNVVDLVFRPDVEI